MSQAGIELYLVKEVIVLINEQLGNVKVEIYACIIYAGIEINPTW